MDELALYAVTKFVRAANAEEAKRKASRRKVDEIRIVEEAGPIDTQVIGFEIPAAEEPWEDPEEG